MMPPLQATLPITSSANMDTDSLPKNYRAVTLRISVGRMLTAQRAIQAAYPRAGGPVMTLGILHALKGQRSVEDLLRALPSALRPLLAFDRVSLAWDRSVSGTLWWHELDAECAISRTDDEVPADLTAVDLPGAADDAAPGAGNAGDRLATRQRVLRRRRRPVGHRRGRASGHARQRPEP